MARAPVIAGRAVSIAHPLLVGKSDRQIARDLGIAGSTIHTDSLRLRTFG
jgi:DNA-binding NarL/FixJ family response regulator